MKLKELKKPYKDYDGKVICMGTGWFTKAKKNTYQQALSDVLAVIKKQKLNLPKTSLLPLVSKIIEKHEWSFNQGIEVCEKEIKKLMKARLV